MLWQNSQVVSSWHIASFKIKGNMIKNSGTIFYPNVIKNELSLEKFTLK